MAPGTQHNSWAPGTYVTRSRAMKLIFLMNCSSVIHTRTLPDPLSPCLSSIVVFLRLSNRSRAWIYFDPRQAQMLVT